MKKNAGFTLIELVVTIAIAAVMMTAVSAVILLGMNNDRVIKQSITTQNDSRVITELLRTLTSRGTITGVIPIGSDVIIQGKDGDNPEITLLSYHNNSGTLESQDGHILMDNIESFGAELDDTGTVLTMTIKADGVEYKRSTYCRTQEFAIDETFVADEEGKPSAVITKIEETIDELDSAETTEEDLKLTLPQRLRFLELLATQYGSDGRIIGAGYGEDQTTYVDWYSHGTWSADTPWCAIFLSWAADFAKMANLIEEKPWRTVDEFGNPIDGFAWVPDGIKYFQAKSRWKTDSPNPGDYIFFNFNTANEEPGKSVADHVGVVLFTYTENGKTRVATIEGNSGGHVAMKVYPIDNASIMGYGVLAWNKKWEAPTGS